MDEGELGKGLFGRALRLRVAIYALRRASFFLTEAARGVDYSMSAVREELHRLVDLGMLRRDTTSGDRRVYFTRVASPLWGIIEAAADVCDTPSPPEPTPVPSVDV